MYKKTMVDISPLSNESWDVYVDRTSDLAEKESEEMGWLSTVEVEVEMAKFKYELLKKAYTKP